MKKIQNRRKKNSKVFLLILLILGISVGYALISSTLNIMGIAGINKNTYDIHWDDTSIVEAPGSVTANTQAYVTDEEKKNISFDVDFELPGDYYEFTVDAKNYGTVDGNVENVVIKFYKDEEEVNLPRYMKYSFTHADDTPLTSNEVIEKNKSIKYKFRLEFDENATILPDEDDEIKAVINVPVVQKKESYKVTFDPKGGTVTPTAKFVTKKSVVGTLPTPTKEGNIFSGWYTKNGEKVTENTVPTANVTYEAHWNEVLPTFGRGQDVNVRLKMLAHDTDPTYTSNNTSISEIRRSTTEPAEEIKNIDHIISAPDSVGPIYAWYDNGTIYWWSDGEFEYLNEDSSYMFNGIKNAVIDTTFDTSEVTNMAYMFGGVGTTLDLSNFDTSKVTNMSYTFAGTGATTLDVSNLDTSKVTSMAGMFTGAQATTLDLHTFDVSNVDNFNSIFSGTGAVNIDISGWNFASTNTMSGMFSGLSKLETINFSNVNTSNITNLSGLVSGSTKIQNLDLSSFDVSNVTTFGLFGGNTGLRSVNINNWNFASTTSLSGFFVAGLPNLESISMVGVNTSNIQNMSTMFCSCGSLTSLDLSSFDTRNVTNMSNMFTGDSNLVTITVSDNFVVDQVTSSSAMFSGCTSIRGGNGTTFNSSKIDKEYAHYDGGTSNPGYFNRIDLDNTYVVTYIDGETQLKQIYVERGNPIGDLPSISKQGYTFLGWYTEPLDGTKVEKTYIPESNITLYARWQEKQKYTVTLEPNGGTVNPTTIEVSEGDKIGTIPTPERTDYLFVGWYTELQGGIKIDNNYKPAGNITIHARYIWIHNTYTVKFDYNDNTGRQYTKEVIKTQPLGEIPESPTRVDYVFTGWYTGLTDGVQIDENTIPTKDTTYYAHWRRSVTEFNVGAQVNKVMKNLAGTPNVMTTFGFQVEDHNITKVIRSTTAPDISQMDENDNVISSYYSDKPIYAWYDNGIIYWWCEDTNPILHEDSSYMFENFKALTEIDVSKWDLSQATNIYDMFEGCENLEALDVSKWDVSKVGNLGHVFYGCKKLTEIDVSKWNTQNATNMAYLFYNCIGLTEIDVSHFKTNNVTSMMDMFSGCVGLTEIDVSHFNTSKVIDMSWMFFECSGLTELDLSHFNTSKVKDMTAMFRDCSNIIDFSDVENFNTDSITRIDQLFSGCSKLEEINLNSWDTSRVKDFSGIFVNCTSLRDVKIDRWDTNEATSIDGIFQNCDSLVEIDLSGWSTPKLNMMQVSFSLCDNLTTIYVSNNFDVSSVEWSGGAFLESYNIVGGNGTTYDASHTNSTYARIDTPSTPGYFTLKNN